MRDQKLRWIWIVPNLFCYGMFIGLFFWVVGNWQGLIEIKRLSIYVIMLLFLIVTALFGSYRIWTWMKDGKM